MPVRTWLPLCHPRVRKNLTTALTNKILPFFISQNSRHPICMILCTSYGLSCPVRGTSPRRLTSSLRRMSLNMPKPTLPWVGATSPFLALEDCTLGPVVCRSWFHAFVTLPWSTRCSFLMTVVGGNFSSSWSTISTLSAINLPVTVILLRCWRKVAKAVPTTSEKINIS